MLLALLAVEGARAAEDAKAQWAEYTAVQPKTIVELQPFRQTSSMQFTAPDGVPSSATLINLNPQINAWFLLTVHRADEGRDSAYHLENSDPAQRVALDESYALGLRIWTSAGPVDCPLWPGRGTTVLQQARTSALPYAPLCGGRLFLRNTVPGTYTNLERITNLLRDHVWGGDKIVQFVREELYEDAFVEHGASGTVVAPAPDFGDAGPRPATLGEASAPLAVRPLHLAIDVGTGEADLRIGQWYPVVDCQGISVSVMQPRAIAPQLLDSFKDSVNPLDPTESGALDFLVAFDMSRFDLAFSLGTDHPRVAWSERSLESMRNARLPGPDGIGQAAPLVATGMVNPSLTARTAATFAGGFKREHGAFRYGPLAQQNSGSHYGFIEQGTIFSKLQPGLATIYVTDSGVMSMKTWTREDDASLAHIRFARQNGVPLIETGANGAPRPGSLVNRWGPGNWSGSSEEHLRTLRAGVCLQEHAERRYLIYGYFSDATPSAMARVFQAYGCRYAMHLDMNALEHTYLALYASRSGQLVVEHLIAGMGEVDRKGGERLAPRFIGFPDDRDFFYLLRKPVSAVSSIR
jgi:hypothetical protein